ncbi:MAG: GDSL-type esterase/lipase family protein [Vicingaceae bacterium]
MEFLLYTITLSAIAALSYFLIKRERTSKKAVIFAMLIVLSVFLLFLELMLGAIYRLENGYWISSLQRNSNSELFESDPYLGVKNKENIDTIFNHMRIRHNSLGYRGSELTNSHYKVVAMGGSTTYGVGVSNDETWTYLLDSLLSDEFQVINMGTPGHTTVEHLVTMALHMDEIKPDVVLLHTGLNDMRVCNTSALKNDYAKFHAPTLYGAMGLCYLEKIPRVHSLYFLTKTLQKLGYFPVCPFHSMKSGSTGKNGLDNKALEIYSRNLDKLIHICGYYTKNIIVIPQILVAEKINAGDLKWWIPYLKTNELPQVLDVYNRKSREVALRNKVMFLDEMLNMTWTADEFYDAGHFNAAGNLKLARLIEAKLSIQHDTGRGLVIEDVALPSNF